MNGGQASPAAKASRPESPRLARPHSILLTRPAALAGMLFLLDCACLLAGYTVAFVSRTGVPIEFLLNIEQLLSFFIFALCVLVAVALIGGYRMETASRSLNYAAEFILAVAVGSVVGFFILFGVFSGTDALVVQSRVALLAAAAAFTPPALLFRFGAARWRDSVLRNRPYLVLGRARDLAEFERTYAATGLKNPLTLVSIDSAETPGQQSDRLTMERIEWELVASTYEAILISDPSAIDHPRLADRLVRMHFESLRVFTFNSFYAGMWRQVPLLHIDLTWALSQDFQLAQRSPYRYVKRFFDLVLGIALFVLALPLMAVIAICIRLDSRGPLIFRQERVGIGRRPFTIYKFRTMQSGRAVQDDPYTRSNDPRVTRFGALLRKLRLDELPQLYNVWKGDMSLIGPRAEWSRLVSHYENEIPFYHLRHLVRPGITGWAQLNHHYGEGVGDAEEKLKYDLYYIKYYSLLLDLEIVLKTALAVLSFRGK
jgi:exopolysaccharide biosynthesis polyprenyl glycosylphosphotransferase